MKSELNMFVIRWQIEDENFGSFAFYYPNELRQDLVETVIGK